MKITDKILSIPPYISTAWKNVVSLQVEARPFGHALVIELVTGNKVEIPNLDGPSIEKIFDAHKVALEEETKNNSALSPMIPFPSLDGFMPMFSTSLGHNPDQKDSPPIPQPILEKIALMAKDALSSEGGISSLKLPEPGCNCPHCQITHAILGQDTPMEVEEEVSDADLIFRTWDIRQESDQFYSVTNPLDSKEQYHVFLGTPLGCSCGEKNCEHIKAVLSS